MGPSCMITLIQLWSISEMLVADRDRLYLYNIGNKRELLIKLTKY